MATTVTLKPNAIDISGSTSGTTTLQATAVAGTTVLTLPAATDTLVGKATTDTLTNKTLTSPVLVTPALGTPASGVVTNLTGTASININGTVGATTPDTGAFTSLAYSTTLTGGTGIVNLGSGQFYKDASGNVGIGTTSPTKPVTVKSASGDGVAVRLFANASEDVILDLFNAAGTTQKASIASDINSALKFSTVNTERMRIDSSGNLMVGTTTNNYSATQGFGVATGTGTYAFVSHASGTGSSTDYIAFSYAGTRIGNITQNGTTGVLYNLTSDYRLKDNAVALTGAKDFVMALQPKTWDWWDGSGKGVGFIAHEFMEVAKHSGSGEKDAVDADNKPIHQAIQPSSSEVMANIVAFIQEQQALITSLTARIAALEST